MAFSSKFTTTTTKEKSAEVNYSPMTNAAGRAKCVEEESKTMRALHVRAQLAFDPSYPLAKRIG